MDPRTPATDTSPRIVFFTRSVTQPSIVASLHRSLTNARDLDCRLTDRADDMRDAAESPDPIVLLVNCLQKEDIADLFTRLPDFEKKVGQGTLRVLVFNSIRHPRLGPLLQSRSAVEILEITLGLKAMQHKVKNALTFVHQSWLGQHGGPSENVPRAIFDFDRDVWTVPKSKEPKAPDPWRNTLTPDERKSNVTGLHTIDTSAVTAGEKAFGKLKLQAEAQRINGERLSEVKDLFVYDMNGTGAVLLMPREFANVGDRLHLHVRLDTGSTDLECTMVWELIDIEVEMEGNRLVSGIFKSGDFDPLHSLLDRLDARKKELNHFFKTAKG